MRNLRNSYTKLPIISLRHNITFKRVLIDMFCQINLRIKLIGVV